MRRLTFPRTGLLALCLGVPGTAGAETIRAESARALLPGPPPRPSKVRGYWMLHPENIAPWASQASVVERLTNVSYFGSERRWMYAGRRVSLVVLSLPARLGCDAGSGGFIVGVLGSKDSLIARSGELIAYGAHAVGVGPSYLIDTAAYRISDNETAFGVRIAHEAANPNRSTWCYADQTLHLFRVVGNDVVRVLTVEMFYRECEGTLETTEEFYPCRDACYDYDAPFPPKDGATLLRMLPTKTNGFYDIQRTGKYSPTLTFRWNGERYLMDGKDPVDHKVRDEWHPCTGRRALQWRRGIYLRDEDGAQQSVPHKDAAAPQCLRNTRADQSSR